MRINSNIASLKALSQVAQTQKAFSGSLERLSSGRRINRAGDDASGLAISGGLEAQMRGLHRAALNINEAQGFLQVADSTISSQVSLVQRIRELALQAANGAIGNTERSFLNVEVQELMAEFRRMTEQTQFNGVPLLDGSMGALSLQVGSRKEEQITFDFPSLQANEIFKRQVGTGKFNRIEDISQEGSTGTFQALSKGDFNGNGREDLVFRSGDSLYLQFNQGDGTFSAPETFFEGLTDVSTNALLRVGDLNGNGHLDIAVVSRSHVNPRFYSFKNDGTGNFSLDQSLDLSGNNIALDLLDLNGNGILDLVYSSGNWGQNLSVRYGNGDGSFQDQVSLLEQAPGIENRIQAWHAADINNDGKVEIFITLWAGATHLTGTQDSTGEYNFVSTGSGFGGNPFGLGGGAASHSDHFVDLNGNGYLDLLSPDGKVSFNNRDGTFTAASDQLEAGSILDFADINSNGFLDLLVRNGSKIQSYLNNGSGGFELSDTFDSTDANISSFGLLLDLNQDGFLDSVVKTTGTSPRRMLAYFGEVTESSAEDRVSVATASEAQDVLEILDIALRELLTSRAQIGSLLSRLESARSNALITQENLAEARSQILDLDFAQETAQLARHQIVLQASIATLTQSNVQLQSVLRLLDN